MSVEILVPSPGESIATVVVGPWSVEDGDLVERDALLCELETDKATLQVVAGVGGRVTRLAATGDTLAVGAPLARIEPSAGVEAARSPAAHPPARPSGPPSPSAAKILREAGIDPAAVPGTGRGGRITRADALAASAAPPPLPPEAPVRAVAARPARPGERREPMSPLRQALARRLVAARNETAMLTTFNEVDMAPALEFRADFLAHHGVKPGLVSLFARAACVALSEWPRINAFVDGHELVHHDGVDLGVAVSTDRGLLVPVVRGAHALDLSALEREIGRLAEKARAGTLSLGELSGGTFTITNGGVFGSLLSTPLLNPPQSAILGLHAIQDRPVARAGQVVIRPMMYVALSYDHRIVDGRESVSFLKRVKALVESPAELSGG